MGDEGLLTQAARLECLLPKLMRRLFTLEPEHPATELPLAQLRICSILQGGPRMLSAIGEELGTSVSAVTQIADRMERSGLVERVAGEDRRMKKLRLTPYGAAMMRSRRETRIRRAAEALQRLPPESREAALRALETLVEASQAPAPEIALDALAGARLEQ